MRKLAVTLVGGFVILLFFYSMLPTISSLLGAIATAVGDDIMTILPKAAVAVIGVGLLLHVLHPKTKDHGKHMVKYGIIMAVASAGIGAALAWGSAEVAHVEPTAFSIAGGMISKVLGGLSSGVAGVG